MPAAPSGPRRSARGRESAPSRPVAPATAAASGDRVDRDARLQAGGSMTMHARLIIRRFPPHRRRRLRAAVEAAAGAHRAAADIAETPGRAAEPHMHELRPAIALRSRGDDGTSRTAPTRGRACSASARIVHHVSHVHVRSDHARHPRLGRVRICARAIAAGPATAGSSSTPSPSPTRGRRPCSCCRATGSSPTATGHVEEVKGPGVVGEQPMLAPGESFTYTSGCPLPTASGTMEGTYQMTCPRRRGLRRADRAFTLSEPYTVH